MDSLILFEAQLGPSRCHGQFIDVPLYDVEDAIDGLEVHDDPQQDGARSAEAPGLWHPEQT